MTGLLLLWWPFFPSPWSPTLGLVHAMMQYSVLVGYLVAGIRSLLRLSLPSLGGFIPSRLCLIFSAFCSFPCYCLLLVLFPPPSFHPSFLPLLSSLVPCSRSLSRILLFFPLSSCCLSPFLLFPFFFQRVSEGFLEGRVQRVITRPFLCPWGPTPYHPSLLSLSLPFTSELTRGPVTLTAHGTVVVLFYLSRNDLWPNQTLPLGATVCER